MEGQLIRWLYHFSSSAFVGLLAYLLISSTSTEPSQAAQDGSINWTFWSRLRLPLVLAVWTHIVADVIEHGEGPRINNGLRQLLALLLDQVQFLIP